MMTGKDLHDRLREELPEGASCIADCPYCADKSEKASKEGQVSENAKVFDQETVDSLLDAARTKAAEEARAEVADELVAAKDALEEKDSALTKVEAEVENLKNENTERDEKARLEELADERSDEVKEVTKFSDEQLEERKAGWAKMEDEAFKALLADLKEVSESAVKAKKDDGKPPKSKLDGTRETAGAEGTDMGVVRTFLATQDA